MLATISNQICTIRVCLATILSNRCTRRRLAHRRAPRQAEAVASSQLRLRSRAKRLWVLVATLSNKSNDKRTFTCPNRRPSSTFQPSESNLASSESSTVRTAWRCSRRRHPSGRTPLVSIDLDSVISDLICFSLATSDRVPRCQDDQMRRQICPLSLP